MPCCCTRPWPLFDFEARGPGSARWVCAPRGQNALTSDADLIAPVNSLLRAVWGLNTPIVRHHSE